MANVHASGGPAQSWLGSDSEESDLRRLLSTLRHRGWLILVTVVLALVVAVAYVKTATPVYQAQANLLVSAVPSGGSIPTNISGLIYQSSDPTRDLQTAAQVITSRQVAAQAAQLLRNHQSPGDILAHISVQPVSDSNVLAVTASASSANAAAALANAFSRATIAVRTAQFRVSVDQQISGLRAQIAASPSTAGTSSGGTTSLNQQLAELESLRSGLLPDMSISALATPPTGRTSPRVTFSLAAGLIVGLVLGVLAILALEAFDLTLRREDQLKSIFRLPVLARIPRDGEKRSIWRLPRTSPPRTPDSLAFATLESFRTLRAMVLASRNPGQPTPRTLLVTSAAPSEGKTTTTLNLAASLASSGSSVVVIEGDLRRPAIGSTLKLLSAYGVASVITGDVPLAQALVSTKRFPGVRFLLAEGMRSQGVSGDALFLPTASQMIKDARALADYVIVDSPPLLAVIDALELARDADAVLLVAQLGRTDLRRLAALGALLAEAHIQPAGIALIGAVLPGGADVYGYTAPRRGRARPRPEGEDVSGEEESLLSSTEAHDGSEVETEISDRSGMRR